MSEAFEYLSHARLLYKDGYRNAYLGESVKAAIRITWDATLHVGEEVIRLSSEGSLE